MKCKVFIDPACEESVLIYARERTPLVEKLEALVTSESALLMGYTDGEILPLSPDEIFGLTVEDGRVIALTARGRLRLRERLYVLEERLGEDFLRINQSCLVRISAIERFHASVGGALRVTLKNGFCDYISRRQLRHVKERMGL